MIQTTKSSQPCVICNPVVCVTGDACNFKCCSRTTTGDMCYYHYDDDLQLLYRVCNRTWSYIHLFQHSFVLLLLVQIVRDVIICGIASSAGEVAQNISQPRLTTKVLQDHAVGFWAINSLCINHLCPRGAKMTLHGLRLRYLRMSMINS